MGIKEVEKPCQTYEMCPYENEEESKSKERRWCALSEKPYCPAFYPDDEGFFNVPTRDCPTCGKSDGVQPTHKSNGHMFMRCNVCGFHWMYRISKELLEAKRKLILMKSIDFEVA